VRVANIPHHPPTTKMPKKHKKPQIHSQIRVISGAQQFVKLSAYDMENPVHKLVKSGA